MKRIRLLLPLLLLVIICRSAVAQEGTFRVDSLAVEGLRFVPEERVRLEFGIAQGDEIDREQLADALRRLSRSRRFAEMQVRAVPTGPDAAFITLQLLEHPRLTGIRWEGLDKIKKKDLEEGTRAGVGSYVSPFLIERDSATILDHCREKGYYGARVATKLEGDEAEPTLVYSLEEGGKTKVKKIRFEGNPSLKADYLRGYLSTKPKSGLNPLTWWHFNSYQPDSIAADVRTLTDIYHQEGYLDARIVETREDFNEKEDEVALTYVIDEGEQYRFGKVRWDGNTAIPDSVIQRYLPFEPGEPFSGFRLDRSRGRISEIYYDQGYLYNQVRAERQIEGREVNLFLRIMEGPLAHVREVVIAGNDKTLDQVIRREVKIYPGELFNREKLIRSHRDIFMLRFFDDVQFEPRSDPGTGDVDLVFRVIERTTGNFGAGVTWSEATKMTGFLQVGAQNFRGRGQTLDFHWEFGSRVQLFNIQFVEPWLRGRPISLSLNVYRSQSNLYREFYRDEKLGFSVGLGRPFPWLEYSRVSAAYRLESIDLFDFSDEYVSSGGTLTERDWPEVESSTTITFVRNSTDNPFLPSKGTRYRLSAQFSGGVLGGNLSYQKYMNQYTWYQRLAGPFVLRFHQTLGFVDGLDRPEQVPDQERFRLGGNRIYPLRGYDDYSVVPVGNSSFLGGRAMMTGAVEAVLGISNSVQVVLPFFDFGGTWNSLSQSDFTTLKRSVGFGARIEVPLMGVLGFDWGYPLDPGESDDGGRFHFKMGTDF